MDTYFVLSLNEIKKKKPVTSGLPSYARELNTATQKAIFSDIQLKKRAFDTCTVYINVYYIIHYRDVCIIVCLL